MPSQRVEIPIGSAQTTAKSPFVSSESLVNCFVEKLPNGIQSIYGGMGLTQFGEIGDGYIRGQHQLGGVLYAVAGDQLFSVDANGNGTMLGGVAGFDPVVMSDNSTQLVIVSDVTSYVLETDTGVYAQINDPDFRIAGSCDFIDQYNIFTEKDSSRWFISNLADATDYDALDVQTAEARPDKLLRAFVDSSEVLLFGTETVEGRYDSGASPFPFAKTQTSLSYGLIGRDAVTQVDNTVAWLANDLTVRTLRGGSPVSIADPAITTQIQSWANPELTQAFTVAIRGHEWMALRNPQGCILWDATTQLWHSRESHDSSTWRASSCVRYNNQLIMGDATEGKLWVLDPDAYSEGSDPLVRTMVSRTLGPGGSPFTLEAVELEIEVGVGLVTGQGSAPVVWMQLSRDSGRTFGTRMTRSIGARGNRNVRVVWTGSFGPFPPHGGVIKFGISDPVSLAITHAWADISQDRL